MILLSKIARTLKTAKSQRSPVRYTACRLLVKTGLCSQIIIRRDGYRLRFHPSNVSVSMFLQGRKFFRSEEQLIQALLRPGDTMIDVGANVGNLSIVGKLKTQNGRVIAIEAHPRTFNFLTSNFALNGLEIEAINIAVGDRAGRVAFSDMHADDCNGIVPDGRGISVPVTTLDVALAGVGPIRLLKVDIEGYELMAFRGASQVLTRTQFVYFELWQDLARRYGYAPTEIVTLVEAAGFNIYRVTPEGLLQRISREENFENLENYLAAREELSPAVVDEIRRAYNAG